ncbi:hypothetical protein B0T10DRAFT_416295 [Thelonectria olida]|uniref:Glucose-methanol-choline oxidoreductase N-terminal domain-containing protein n=1 Tax=Thelonectria olida TaxID=1576542 RepID=A0A9P8VR57_9HYPO|nr:hypothetical protein B0T10DRAFT_416295 [Thelonectria olida]
MGSIANPESYDYIIVGGGTAGLTVADRLTEDADITVLVVEAGEDRTSDPVVLTPGLVAGMYGKAEYDWNFTSVPQPELNNRKLNQARGKQLGGSSALNFMMLAYPSRYSLDAWGALGNDGWNYDSMAPYFRKFGTVHAPPQAAKDVVGLAYHDDSLIGNGPIQVSFSEGYNITNAAWMETFSQLGLAMTADMRSGAALGAFQPPGSIDPVTKTRSFAATAHYTPEISSRPNLTLMAETVVKRIIFDTSRPEPVATGVLTQSRNGTKRIVNAGEVILAAGSLMTPQILELSGVGSKTLLDSLDLPVVIDNPWVGENLQDHLLACQSFEVNPDVPSSDVLRDPNVLNVLIGQYHASRAGPMGQSNTSVAYAPFADASGVCSAEDKKALFAAHEEHTQTPEGQVLRSILEATDGEPTAQYMLFPGQFNTALPEPSSMADYLMPARPENYITVVTVLNHPFSRGSVHISSVDIHALPTWDPRFNTNPLDLEVAARHLQFVEERIASTPPFSELLKPGGARIPEIRVDSLESAKEVVRQTQVSSYHPVGSCAMKPREKGGVVDTRLRVYGAKRLRIVDASVFPLEPVGNIQSVVYAVAERAADLIKEDRNLSLA